MLTVIYDEYEGQVVPDAKARDFAETTCANAKTFISTVFVGSDIMVNAFRLMVVLGYIKAEDICFVYRGETARVHESGGLTEWPKGMCEISFNMLRTLSTYRKLGIDYTKK